MSLLAVTTCEGREALYVSQDQAIALPRGGPRYTEHGGPSSSYAEAVDTFYCERGPAPVAPDMLATKATQLGDLVVAGLGSFGMFAAMLGALRAADVATVDDAVEFMCGPWRPAAPDLEVAHVILAGYSASQGVCCAWSCSSPGFVPELVDVGHLLHPVPYPGDPEHEGVRQRWEPAVRGDDVLGFHRDVAANVARAWQARRMRHEWSLGGDLVTFRVTAEGIDRKTMAIPGCAEAAFYFDLPPDQFLELFEARTRAGRGTLTHQTPDRGSRS